MALDPSIIMATGDINNPQRFYQTVQHGAQTQKMLQQAQAAMRLRDLASSTDMSTPEGQQAFLSGYAKVDPLNAIPEMQKYALAQQEMAKSRQLTALTALQAQTAKIKTIADFNQRQASILSTAKDQPSYEQALSEMTKEAQQLGIDTTKNDHPPAYDPQWVAGKLQQAMTYDQQLKEAHQKAEEQARAMQITETSRHNQSMEGIARRKGAGVAMDGVTTGGAPVGSDAHGEEYLSTLQPTMASQVKALAEGRMQFPSGFALKSPYWQSLLRAVGQYAPNFDAVNYNARAKTRSDFTSGKAGQTINGLNTGIAHLNQLSDLAEQLNNGSMPSLNAIGNFFSKQSGHPQVTNFNTVKKQVADEVTRIWRGSGGSEKDIQDIMANLDAANSPDQLRGSIYQLTELMGGKVRALEEQYKTGMGITSDNFTMLKPEAQAALSKIAGRAGKTVTVPSGPTAPSERSLPPTVQAKVDAARAAGHSEADISAALKKMGY